MRAWPHSLGGRVFLALAVAVVGVVALDLGVRRRDAAAATVAGAPPPVEPEPGQRLLLGAVGGDILFARRLSSIEPTVAPVVQLLADGSSALRRPAPLATGPGEDPRAAARRAAIVLPGASLAELVPVARGTLVDLVSQLVVDRPVSAARFRAVDFDLRPDELRALLAWVP